jgi:hypothetical protein
MIPKQLFLCLGVFFVLSAGFYAVTVEEPRRELRRYNAMSESDLDYEKPRRLMLGLPDRPSGVADPEDVKVPFGLTILSSLFFCICGIVDVYYLRNHWSQIPAEVRTEYLLRYLLLIGGGIVSSYFFITGDINVSSLTIMATVIFFIAIPYRNEISRAMDKPIGETLGIQKGGQNGGQNGGYTLGTRKIDE